MDCPACKKSMQQVSVGDVVVEQCAHGCNAIWFDSNELDRMDNGAEFAPAQLLKSAAAHPPVGRALGCIRRCPKCTDQVLVRQMYDLKASVEIDQCWECSGILLDLGELANLRAQFATESDLKQALNQRADNAIDQAIEVVDTEGKKRIERFKRENSCRLSAARSAIRELLFPGSSW